MKGALTVGLVWVLTSILSACSAGPATPDAVAPSLDGWNRIGLFCSGPTTDNIPSGLLQWMCHGTLRGAALTAVLEGDDKGVFSITARVPAGTNHSIALDVFDDLVGATSVLSNVRGEVNSWMRAWEGQSSRTSFGMTQTVLEADAASITSRSRRGHAEASTTQCADRRSGSDGRL